MAHRIHVSWVFKRQEGSSFSTFRPPDSTAPVFAAVMFYAPMLAEGVVQNNLTSGNKLESHAIKENWSQEK